MYLVLFSCVVSGKQHDNTTNRRFQYSTPATV